MSTEAPGDTPHDTYLAGVADPGQRAALQTLRRTIRQAAPQAVEVMSYGVPAFRTGPGKGGKLLVGYAAMKAHCGFYVFEGDLVARFAEALAGYSTSTGTVRFTACNPLPDDLVRRMVAARLDEVS